MNNLQLIYLFTDIGSALVDIILRPTVFLYLGPDTLLPAASICGAAVGFVLIFGRYIISMAKKMVRKIRGQEEPVPVEGVLDSEIDDDSSEL